MPERRYFLCIPDRIKINDYKSKIASKYTASLRRRGGGEN